VDCVIVFGLVLRSVSFRACLINHKVVRGLCHCVFDSAFHIGSVGEVLVVALIFGGAVSFYLHIYIHTHTTDIRILTSCLGFSFRITSRIVVFSLSSISLDRLISSFLSPVAVLVVVVLVVAIAIAVAVPNHYTSPLRP